jgi:hypothetical protein
MGTRSTVKFYQDGKNILSVYHQYDGYIEGVGKQIANLLEQYRVVNGIPLETDEKIANGISELALFYVIDNKDGNGNIYATSEDDSQEFNYEIRSTWGAVDNDEIRVKVDNDYDGNIIFEGTANEFIKFVKGLA